MEHQDLLWKGYDWCNKCDADDAVGDDDDDEVSLCLLETIFPVVSSNSTATCFTSRLW